MADSRPQDHALVPKEARTSIRRALGASRTARHAVNRYVGLTAVALAAFDAYAGPLDDAAYLALAEASGLEKLIEAGLRMERTLGALAEGRAA